MSEFFTWAEIKEKVEQDLDLEDENFITEPEMMGLANEAIRDVEREVHKLNEDYFYSYDPLTLVSGQEDYSLPSDIFAMKIRGIAYRNGVSVWPINRVRDWKKMQVYEYTKASQSKSQIYSYMVLNKVAGSPKIRILPVPQESGAYVTVYYLRQASRITDDSSICDLPEAVDYIIQCIKVRCYEKDRSPMYQDAKEERARLRQATIDALAEKTPDGDTTLEIDTTPYEEHT